MKLYDFGAAVVLFGFITWAAMVYQEYNGTREIAHSLAQAVGTENDIARTLPDSLKEEEIQVKEVQ